MVKTYLLKGKPGDIHAASKGAVYYNRHGRRAVLVTDIPPGDYLIAHSYRGDERARYEAEWLKRTPLDELHDRYVQNSPVRPSVQRAAEKRLKDARKRVEKAEKDVVRAKKLLRAAEAYIITTHGRSPVVDGQQYAASFSGETVYLTRVMSKAEVIERQRAAAERKAQGS